MGIKNSCLFRKHSSRRAFGSRSHARGIFCLHVHSAQEFESGSQKSLAVCNTRRCNGDNHRNIPDRRIRLHRACSRGGRGRVCHGVDAIQLRERNGAKRQYTPHRQGHCNGCQTLFQLHNSLDGKGHKHGALHPQAHNEREEERRKDKHPVLRQVLFQEREEHGAHFHEHKRKRPQRIFRHCRHRRGKGTAIFFPRRLRHRARKAQKRKRKSSGYVELARLFLISKLRQSAAQYGWRSNSEQGRQLLPRAELG